jgi:hypothetical protein
MTTLTARLHPKWLGGRDGYRYSVICRGELIVDRSRDPECDAARALLAKGIAGKLTLLDGKMGKARIVIDIERCAGLTVKDGPLRFAPYEGRPNSSHSPEKARELDRVVRK